MKLRTRTSIAALAIASVVGGGITGAVLTSPAVALAQTAEDQATDDTPSTSGDVVDREARRGSRFGGRLLGAASEDVANILGMTVDEIRDAVRAGSSVADLAAANGADLQQVIDLLVVQAQERLDEAVADGRLTAAEAAEKVAGIETRVTEMVNGEFAHAAREPGARGGGDVRGGPGEQPGAGEDLDSANTDA